MEKKPLKKLTLKKSIISQLSADEQAMVKGGAFTSSGNCTGWLCCDGGGTAACASNTYPCCTQVGATSCK